ncbi:MAG TPA: RHS repeat-associated core domain-containing protein [Terriglobales bacterium]|jgi:RHS repeat-associated protein|nr:RHS repeat-associated core domain-containing protein [Terriglobales bacterium]
MVLSILWQFTDQINTPNTQTCTYLYDDLGRVGLPPGSSGKSVDCGSTKWQQNFSFDPFGNITKTVPSGGTGLSFVPTYSTGTNRYQSLPGFTPTYNGSGNLTADGTHTYSWDVENNATQVDTTGVQYDALGRMVELDTPTYNTEWVYSPTGEKWGLMLFGQTFAGAWIPLPGGGRRLYQVANGTVSGYTHLDWLGSYRLVTSDTQTLISDVAYAPFGEDYADNGAYLEFASGGVAQSTTSGTGSQGLYDFDFRRYSPSQGRWISPDPAGLAAVDPTDPQSWNRYGYVGNRPLNTVDPMGLAAAPCPPDSPPGTVCTVHSEPAPSDGNSTTSDSTTPPDGSITWVVPWTVMVTLRQYDDVHPSLCRMFRIGCGHFRAANNGTQQPQQPQQPKPPQPNPQPPQDPNRFFSEKTCFYLDWATAYAGVVALPNAENPVGWALGIGTVVSWGVGKVGGC